MNENKTVARGLIWFRLSDGIIGLDYAKAHHFRIETEIKNDDRIPTVINAVNWCRSLRYDFELLHAGHPLTGQTVLVLTKKELDKPITHKITWDFKETAE